MSRELKFIFISILIPSVLSSAAWFVSFVILMGWFGRQVTSRDLGLGILLPIFWYMLIALFISAVIYILSYFLLMRYASRQNKDTVQILHPRRDFAIAFVPSLILSGLLIYALVSSFLFASPLRVDNRASRQSTQSATASATPSPTPTPLSGEKVTLHTAPLPTTITMPKSGSVAGESTSAQVSAVKTTMAEISDAIKKKDSDELYNMLSSQLTDIFPPATLKLAFTSLQGDTGMTFEGDPQVSGEWATQQVSYVNNGETKRYIVVLHLENGEWKLFGTANQ